MSHRILIVEDDVAMAQLLVEGLRRRGFTPTAVHGGEAALSALAREPFEAVVTDLNMKGLDGIALCGRIVEGHPGVPVLVVTAFGSLETAIQAIRAGAYDFITKPFELEALRLALTRAVAHQALREEVKRLRTEADRAQSAAALVGDSQAMREVRSLISRVADNASPVLLTGERGSGREVVARVIHDASRRRAHPFVAVDCGAVPEALLEAELFGTASPPRPGLLVRAEGGTVLLNDVAELPLSLQPRLVRALQERKVRPVGGEREVPFEARVLCATSRDLETEVEAGRFRDDLLLGVSVITVHLPPLRLRGNDVLLLAQHFVRLFAEKNQKQVTGLSTAVAERLVAYRWPGNVAELRNVVEHAVALTRYEQLTVEDLPEKVRRPQADTAGEADEAALVSLDTVERHHILRVLRALGGHRSHAAKVLGLDRKTLYRKLERYGPEEVAEALRGAPARDEGDDAG